MDPNRSKWRCNSLTVYMSHLPVRDVHLLVVSWRERKNHNVSSGKDSVSVRLHHLGESSEDWMMEMRTLITFGCKILRVTVLDYLVDSDEALGVHVDAALFQEARCRNTSCRRGDTFLDVKLFKGEFHHLMCHCRWWRKVKQFFITCSDDTNVRPQDFPALQHHLFELRDRKNKMSRPSHRDARLYTWTASYSFCETMTSL